MLSDRDITNILGGSLMTLFARVRAAKAPVPKEYSPKPDRVGEATEGVTPW